MDCVVIQVTTSVEQLRADGQALLPPFTWSLSLREHLHEMLRAFEAWIVKEYGCVCVSLLFFCLSWNMPLCFAALHADVEC